MGGQNRPYIYFMDKGVHIMSILDAIIQGIVQGLTEFLPVSSSGHLSITQHILGATENNLFFNVMLHVGTLVAVVALEIQRMFLWAISCGAWYAPARWFPSVRSAWDHNNKCCFFGCR